MTASWTIDSIPNLANTTVIVTGANSGIGLEAARVFAAKGAHVVFPMRSQRISNPYSGRRVSHLR